MMNEAITEVIKQHLPEAAAKQMKEFIQQAESWKVELGLVKGRMAEKDAKIMELNAQVIAKRNLEVREAEVRKKLEEIQAKELELLRKEAWLIADVANASKEATIATAGMFLKLPEYRKFVSRDVVTPVEGVQPNQYNSCGTMGYVQKDTLYENTTETHG